MDEKKPDISSRPVTSRLTTLPPIANRSMTESLATMEAKMNRTIETDFGTIVIDSRGIQVVPSPQLSSELEQQRQQQQVQSDTGAGGGGRVFSRMFLFDTSTTSSRLLAMATERERRLERGVWGSDAALLLAVCSYHLGLGASTKFGWAWIQRGGVPFLFAFLVFQLLVGLPMMMLEATLGQFAGHGQAALMPQMAPALKGYSHAFVLGLCIQIIAYGSDIGSMFIYTKDALQQPQPWLGCNATYNTDLCYTIQLDRACRQAGGAVYFEKRCVYAREICGSVGAAANWTEVSTTGVRPRTTEPSPPHREASLRDFRTACVVLENGSVALNLTRAPRRSLAADEYYDNVASSASYRTHKQLMHAPSLLAMLVCWLAAALVSHRGLDGVPLTLPLVLGLPLLLVLMLMVIFMMTQGQDGHFWNVFTSDLAELRSANCWVAAAAFSLFSLGIGTGTNTILYSRNLLTHDCKRSSVTLALLNTALCAMFTLPYNFIVRKLAADLDMDVESLVDVYRGQHSTGLLMDALANLEHSYVWATAYTLACTLLGLGSLQVMVLTVEASLRELEVIRDMSTRAAVCLICTAFFVLDVLLFTFPGGFYISLSIKHFSEPFTLIILTFVVVIAVKSHGVHRMLDVASDIMSVPMRWTRWFWDVSWRYVCPIYLVVIFILLIVNLAVGPPQHRGVPLPSWTSPLGAFLVALVLVLLVFEVFHEQHQAAKWRDVFEATERWQPGLLTPAELGLRHPSDPEKGASGLSGGPSLMTRLYGSIPSRLLDQPHGSALWQRTDDSLDEESESEVVKEVLGPGEASREAGKDG